MEKSPRWDSTQLIRAADWANSILYSASHRIHAGPPGLPCLSGTIVPSSTTSQSISHSGHSRRRYPQTSHELFLRGPVEDPTIQDEVLLALSCKIFRRRWWNNSCQLPQPSSSGKLRIGHNSFVAFALRSSRARGPRAQESCR